MLTPAQALHFLISKVAADAYDPPMSVADVRKKYPKLLKDPAHLWRAQNGIELIHREPSTSELNRIWSNWQRMKAEQKKISDQKSLELFGVTNADNYKNLQVLCAKVAADAARGIGKVETIPSGRLAELRQPKPPSPEMDKDLHTTKLPPGIDTSNPKVQAFLKKLQGK